MKRFFLFLFLLILIGLGYLFFAPVNIEPISWHAPKAPKYNSQIPAIQRIAQDQGIGPECVLIHPTRKVLITGYDDGKIVQMDFQGGNIKELTNTTGRPLGLAWYGNDIIIADAIKGLLRLKPSGEVTLLTDSADGQPLKMVDDVAVAKDGMIYFTDTSRRWGLGESTKAMIEHRGTGRLLSYNPKTRETETVMDGLNYANGVTLSPNEDFILVNETGSYQIMRHWLKGAQAGQNDIFAANLPGFPDNIRADGKGNYWVALYAPRNELLDNLSPYPFLRKALVRLPPILLPKPVPFSLGVRLDANGKIITFLEDSGDEAYAPITHIQAFQDQLFFGSLGENAIGMMPWSDK